MNWNHYTTTVYLSTDKSIPVDIEYKACENDLEITKVYMNGKQITPNDAFLEYLSMRVEYDFPLQEGPVRGF